MAEGLSTSEKRSKGLLGYDTSTTPLGYAFLFLPVLRSPEEAGETKVQQFRPRTGYEHVVITFLKNLRRRGAS